MGKVSIKNLHVADQIENPYLVFSTGNQTVNGVKDFSSLPTVNGTPLSTGFGITAIDANGQSMSGLVVLTPAAGLGISGSGSQVIFSANNLLSKQSCSLKSFNVTSGVGTEFYSFGTVYPFTPTVVATLRNSVDQYLLGFQTSGVSTSGFYATYSEAAPNGNFKLDIFVGNTTNNNPDGTGVNGWLGSYGLAGYTSRALVAADVNLTADQNEINQNFSGTLSSSVSIILATGALKGKEFRLKMDGLAIGTPNILNIKSATQTLVTYSLTGILSGGCLAVSNGTGWEIMQNEISRNGGARTWNSSQGTWHWLTISGAAGEETIIISNGE